MSRLVWFAAGAATGVYGLVRAKRLAANFTPDGIAARAAALGLAMRMFADEVSVGMAEREAQLRRQMDESRHIEAPPPTTAAIAAPRDDTRADG